MLYHNLRVGAHVASTLDALIFVGTAAGLWHLGAAQGRWPATDAGTFWWFGAAFVPAFVLLSERFGVYHPWRTERLRPEMMLLTEVTLYAAGLATVVAAAMSHPPAGLPTAVTLGAGLLTLLSMRLVVRLGLRRLRQRGDDYRVWLIVGRNARAASLLQDIERNRHYGIRVAEVIDVAAETDQPAMDEAQVATLSHYPVRRIATLDDLRGIIVAGVVDEVVITLPMRSCYDRIHELLELCGHAGISVKLQSDMFEVPDYRRALSHVGDIPMLTHFRGPSNYGQLLAKRMLDLTASGLALVLLTPLFAAIALAVKLGSPGPVLFRQQRVGLHGRQFSIFKFRTMFIDAPVRHQALKAGSDRDGLAFKMKNDPRVTRVGRILRKFHLDELPQLLNVALGDMSLVGPRPLPVQEAIGHEWWQRRRLTVPPGLTCLWQVQDDPTIPFQQWMRMDMEYIDKWSFWLDLKLIALTFGTLARGRGW